ncbi:MAG: adenine deaminase [Cytophagales bacterium]|nr:adenine deaminase [Cytophagales bacterium]
MILEANLIDLHQKRIFYGRVQMEQDKITHRQELGPERSGTPYLMPGFIDAHIHIESSLLVPSEFARVAVRHGTVATVSDPHEIANVLGVKGVRFMLDNAAQVPFHFFFGAPSCVPATAYETAGARLGPDEVENLLRDPHILYLSEMMNWPGVLGQDAEVMEKLALARRYGKPVDGHAPGLRGEQAQAYAAQGISTDHECFTLDEAREKIALGMKVIIREGSAARNFEALWPLLLETPDWVMLCSDDKHPDELLAGHINQLAARAVAKGVDHWAVMRAACLNPILHYQLPLGTLQPGDPADCILVSNLRKFDVLMTCIQGQVVFEGDECLIPSVPVRAINRFQARACRVDELAAPARSSDWPVIVALDGQIVTERETHVLPLINGSAQPDPIQDLLKITVVNRYMTAPPAVAFIRGFGLREGALASTVAHDSHNIVAVGSNDENLCLAVNELMRIEGGMVAVADGKCHSLALPVAGLMSLEDAPTVSQAYQTLDTLVKKMGSGLSAPFMTLSFMALLVIPRLKLSDKGLFDAERFTFVP